MDSKYMYHDIVGITSMDLCLTYRQDGVGGLELKKYSPYSDQQLPCTHHHALDSVGVAHF